MTDATPKLRVLFCHFTADVSGGSDRSLFDLVTHLPKEQFAPIMVLKKGDPLAKRYRDAQILTYEITLVPPRRALEFYKLFLYALFFFPSVLQIIRIILKEQVRVVHVNTLTNLQGALAAHLSHRSLVWHIRELMPDSRLIRFFLACVRRWATLVIPNSHAVAASVADCGDRVRVVHNGIDLSEYESLPQCVDGPPIVSVIGRLEPWKGQHVLLEAFPEVLKKHPAAQLWIVGGSAVNKPEYLPQLQCRAEELGITESIRFTGIRHDIPAVLAACNILVLPSVTPEPFGRTIIEAMAARCPVIATRQGGPLEIVREGVTGMLIPPDDSDALADALNHLIDQPAYAKQLGEKGREIAFKYFSLDRVVEEVGAILKAAIL